MSSCYLCNYNCKNKKPGIALHRFPKHVEIRKQWFSVCGLSEDVDDVKSIRICTSHFALNDVQPPLANSNRIYPTLRFGAIPSISVPYPIQSRIQTSLFDLQAQGSPQTTKKRRFQDPRYISEVTLSDVSSPKRAKKVIDLIKKFDAEKSKKIKQLQEQRRYLIKRVKTFKELVFGEPGEILMDGEVLYEGPIEDLVNTSIIETPSRPESRESDFFRTNSQSRASIESPSKKKKGKINERDNIGNLLDDAVHCLRGLNQKPQEEESHNVVFSKLVAAEMDNITDPYLLDETKRKIFDIILRAKKEQREKDLP